MHPAEPRRAAATGRHSLHLCRSPEIFCMQFESTAGLPVRQVADSIIDTQAPRAIFLVGSLPLGTGTNGSDADFTVLVDDRSVLNRDNGAITNSDRRFAFMNENNPLLAGRFVSVVNGVDVEVHIVIVSTLRQIFERLRNKGPELGEGEIMTLGRLAGGWLLWESAEYLQQRSVVVNDPALHIYCCTRYYVTALQLREKALKALELADLCLTQHLGRSSVEMVYLAYFASEGLSYLGTKWLAQLGHGYGAAQRLGRHPLLRDGLRLLFPQFGTSSGKVAAYLEGVRDFLAAMKVLIAEKKLFRIAFEACPQIRAISARAES